MLINMRFIFAIAGFVPIMWGAMAESFSPSPWVSGGFMMAGLTLSIVLSVFMPGSRKRHNLQQ
ncbi:hypothetical protein [Fictibacillus terranigra]|uniref:Major facilitator superfamily (MFS) profile domain-containing protein n=1 Tax=Fictibacillus terranigra TaxID=3058424 RepID=A0ABT8EDH7_9BACL|nr:hypothetical protein [Fictibacillus sp. CENA-BCM004]MDN4075970.1 hypothetical protein [Fictibacillus sp. CENA-BCM004]